MTVEECYGECGGSYKEVLARLGKDERIVRYLRLFLSEEGFFELIRTLGEKDYQKAFEHAHNLKGAALNLSLESLFEKAAVLCEALRGGEPKGDVEAMLEDVTQEYERVKNAVAHLD